MEVNMKGIVLRVKSPKNFHSRKMDVAYFFKRYGLFTMFLFTILLGMVTGIYVGGKTTTGFKNSFDFLFMTDFSFRCDLDFLELFSSCFSSAFIFAFAVILLGFCPWSNIVLPLITLFKGFGAGLTLTQLCNFGGIKGFFFFLIGVIPGFFMMSAVLSMQGEQSFRLSADIFKVIIRKKDVPLNIREYLLRSGVYLFFAMISSLLDTVLFIALFNGFDII